MKRQIQQCTGKCRDASALLGLKSCSEKYTFQTQYCYMDLTKNKNKKQKIRGKWKNLNKKLRQCGTHIRIMFSAMHRSTLEQFSQLFIFTTTSYFISLIFFYFPEPTQAFIASWYSSVLPLCFYSLLPFKDKHLTPGKQMTLISTKAKVYACLWCFLGCILVNNGMLNSEPFNT